MSFAGQPFLTAFELSLKCKTEFSLQLFHLYLRLSLEIGQVEHLNRQAVSFLINNICEGDKVLLPSGLFIDKLCMMMAGYKDKMKGQLIQLQVVKC